MPFAVGDLAARGASLPVSPHTPRDWDPLQPGRYVERRPSAQCGRTESHAQRRRWDDPPRPPPGRAALDARRLAVESGNWALSSRPSRGPCDRGCSGLCGNAVLARERQWRGDRGTSGWGSARDGLEGECFPVVPSACLRHHPPCIDGVSTDGAVAGECGREGGEEVLEPEVDERKLRKGVGGGYVWSWTAGQLASAGWRAATGPPFATITPPHRQPAGPGRWPPRVDAGRSSNAPTRPATAAAHRARAGGRSG